MPEHVRHEDWRVGDPTGAPLDEIRRVRADIEYRVKALRQIPGVPVAERGDPSPDESAPASTQPLA
jgi:hypothetical protein